MEKPESLVAVVMTVNWEHVVFEDPTDHEEATEWLEVLGFLENKVSLDQTET